jgi:hypothetical protein
MSGQQLLGDTVADVFHTMHDLDFAIVDPHFHHWDPLTTPRVVSPFARVLHRWPRVYEKVASVVMPQPASDFLGGTSILYPYMPGEYAKDAEGLSIDTVVHVESGWEQRGKLGAVGETRWIDQLHFARWRCSAPVALSLRLTSRLTSRVHHSDVCSVHTRSWRRSAGRECLGCCCARTRCASMRVVSSRHNEDRSSKR